MARVKLLLLESKHIVNMCCAFLHNINSKIILVLHFCITYLIVDAAEEKRRHTHTHTLIQYVLVVLKKRRSRWWEPAVLCEAGSGHTWSH